MAAGRKVGHRFKDHCLAHIRPLFWLYEILRERYAGLLSANVPFVFMPSGSIEERAFRFQFLHCGMFLTVKAKDF